MVCYYPQFQAFTRGLGTEPPPVREDYCHYLNQKPKRNPACYLHSNSDSRTEAVRHLGETREHRF